MNIYYEIIGYTGTFLVLLSMMMTSVVKLRVVNIMGSFFSMTYAVLSNAWPVVFLNAGLIIINVFQLIRFKTSKKPFLCITVATDDERAKYFINSYEKDIKLHFPKYEFHPRDNETIRLVYLQEEIAGIFISEQKGDTLYITLDYTSPKYRDTSVGKYLYSELEKAGIKHFISESISPIHDKYLERIGFIKTNGKMEKIIK